MFKVRGPKLLRSGTKWEQCQEYSKKTSLAVQWLRFHVPELEGHGFSWSGKIPHEAQYDQKKKKNTAREVLINCCKWKWSMLGLYGPLA